MILVGTLCPWLSGVVAAGPVAPPRVLYSEISGDPTAQVPGLSVGTEFRDLLTLTGNASGELVVWAFTTETAEPNRQVYLLNGQTLVGSGTSAPWAPTLTIRDLRPAPSLGDDGRLVFVARVDPGNTEALVRFESGTFVSVANEGDPVSQAPGATWTGDFESPATVSGGPIGWLGDISEMGTFDALTVLGSTVLLRDGLVLPGTSGAFPFVSANRFMVSSNGGRWLAKGLIRTPSSQEVVVLDGSIVVERGQPLAGSGSSDPVDDIGRVFLGRGGDWLVRGRTNGNPWALKNGALIAEGGSPIVTGSTERWTTDNDAFVFAVANSQGIVVLAGRPDSGGQAVTLDGTDVVLRSGDQVDLDGNGMADDGVRIRSFRDVDGVGTWLSDDGRLSVIAEVEDLGGTELGAALLQVDLGTSAGGLDLTVELNATPEPVIAGSGAGNLVHRATVINQGPGTATGIEIVYNLNPPAGTSLTAWTATSGTLTETGNDNLRWQLPALLQGAAAELTAEVTVGVGTAPGTDVVPAIASLVAADQALINTSDDGDSVSSSVVGRARLEAELRVGGQLMEGGSVEYQVAIRNVGGIAAPDSPGDEFTLLLPAEIELTGVVNDSSVGGTGLESNPSRAFFNGAIPSGQAAAFRILGTLREGTDGSTVSAQADIAYDSDGDGTADVFTLSDDPAEPGTLDPTAFVVGGEDPLAIPTLAAWAKLTLLLLVGLVALSRLRQGLP